MEVPSMQMNKPDSTEFAKRASGEERPRLDQPSSGGPVSFSNPDEVEDEIAGIMLKALQDKDAQALEQSWSTVERGCFELVQTGRRSKATISYRPLLDGLLRLVDISPSMSRKLYSCVVLISCYSVEVWTAFVRAGVLDSHTEIQDLIAKIAARMNPVWRHWEVEDQALVAESMMELSNIDKYEEAYILSTNPVTPISIAVTRCIALASGSTNDDDLHMPRRLLYDIIKRSPSWAWESLRNEDLLNILNLCPESVILREEINKRMLLLPAKNLHLGTKIKASSPYGAWKSVTAETRLSLDPITATTEEYPPESIVSPSEAYNLVKVLEGKNDVNAIHSAVSTWLSLNKPSLVAAAYVAAPQKLRLKVEQEASVHYHIEKIPSQLVSGLDPKIDEHLAGLLGSVQEIADVYGINRDFDCQSHVQYLKRVAVLHPGLMVRRIDSICAAGRTVLGGLSTPSQILDDEAIKVLEYLFDIISGLSYEDSNSKRDVSNFSVKTLAFLTDERRLPDGIPNQLETIARLVVKTIESCIEEDTKPRIRPLLESLANANRGNEILMSDMRNLSAALALSTDMKKTQNSR